MNVFLKYLEQNELDIQNMSSDEIIGAYNASGSSSHDDLKEIVERLPWMKRLQVLLLRLDDVVYPSAKGEHVSDN